MEALPVRIAGTGYYLPPRIVTNAELEERLHLKPGWIERATGVRERRYSSGETAAQMASAALRMALDQAGLGVGDVDAFIGASAAPQQMIPCTAALVQEEIGAPDGGSVCFDVNGTCLSFALALHTVAPLVAAGVYKTAAIFSSEVTGFSLNPDEPESAVLMGDAAAAVVLTRATDGAASRLHHARFATYSSGADLTRIEGGGSRHHPNNPLTKREQNLFAMNGPGVFRMVSRLFPAFMDDFFAAVGWERGKVDAVVPHQASGRGVSFVASRVGFRPEQVVVNLPVRGNCVAASLPLALAEAVHAGRIRRGARVILAGTGAGLTLGALALTY